jgi:hypothetical protein
MKNLLVIATVLFTLQACKKDTKIEKTEVKELITEVESYFDGVTSDGDIDNLGNFKFDTGAASTGRVSGNLSNVFISLEILPERPGCADICPETAIIHFKCENGTNCVTDPFDPQLSGYHNEGAISFQNLETGKKVYTLLNQIKNKLHSKTK